MEIKNKENKEKIKNVLDFGEEKKIDAHLNFGILFDPDQKEFCCEAERDAHAYTLFLRTKKFSELSICEIIRSYIIEIGSLMNFVFCFYVFYHINLEVSKKKF
jgi:hypothetical protein